MSVLHVPIQLNQRGNDRKNSARNIAEPETQRIK